MSILLSRRRALLLGASLLVGAVLAAALPRPPHRPPTSRSVSIAGGKAPAARHAAGDHTDVEAPLPPPRALFEPLVRKPAAAPAVRRAPAAPSAAAPAPPAVAQPAQGEAVKPPD